MSSWINRLRPGITLVSPKGNRFEAKWRGDDITIQKRVNRVSHPDQDGESSQDLGLNSPDYPFVLYFDGPDCDLKEKDFSRAFAERGVWEVTHPLYGYLRLQPVKIVIRAQPVESGNVIEVSSEWFEPAEDGAAPAPDTSAAVSAAVSALSETALADAEQISQKAAASAEASQSVARQFRKGLDFVKGALRSANDRITAIMETINDLTMQAYLDVAALSGAVIQLYESPGLFAGSISNRVSMFALLGNRMIADLLAAVGVPQNKPAIALTGELWLNAVACGVGMAITEKSPQTRGEALAALRLYRAFLERSAAVLDALAKASAIAPGRSSIREQYFPRVASAEAILTLNAAIARHMMSVAFDLKTEKRIVLDRPTSPLFLTIREYNCTAANADYYYDLLCRSNNLLGRELLLLPAGREVVIYA